MPSETDVALKAKSGTDGGDWKSPDGAMLRAPSVLINFGKLGELLF